MFFKGVFFFILNFVYPNGRKPIPPDNQVHHLNGITTDNRIDNLLCASISEHNKADARQRALRALVPEGDLRSFPYDRLRYLQDPRTLSDEDFQKELDRIRDQFRTGSYRFSYFKKDSSIREAVGTLNLALIPEEHQPKSLSAARSNNSEENSTFRYYDLSVHGWRSFRLDLFIGFVEKV